MVSAEFRCARGPRDGEFHRPSGCDRGLHALFFSGRGGVPGCGRPPRLWRHQAVESGNSNLAAHAMVRGLCALRRMSCALAAFRVHRRAAAEPCRRRRLAGAVGWSIRFWETVGGCGCRTHPCADLHRQPDPHNRPASDRAGATGCSDAAHLAGETACLENGARG